MSWSFCVKNIHTHTLWDNSITPVLKVAPGDSVQVETKEASNGVISKASSKNDILKLDSSRANPVTGPIFVEGARPGDALVVEIIDAEVSGWGWTGLIPDFGLLADDFKNPFLHISSHTDEEVEFTPEIRFPTLPFPGTIGVAPPAGEVLPLIPPHSRGGNMDIKVLLPGATIVFPIAVEGGLLSVGDTHAAQGDGEVCGTAIESPMTLTLKISLQKDCKHRFPRIILPHTLQQRLSLSLREADTVVTMGVSDSIFQAARDAVREMIDYLCAEFSLSPELAYCLTSVAGDLAIREIVNAPNWVVTMSMSRACMPK